MPDNPFRNLHPQLEQIQDLEQARIMINQQVFVPNPIHPRRRRQAVPNIPTPDRDTLLRLFHQIQNNRRDPVPPPAEWDDEHFWNYILRNALDYLPVDWMEELQRVDYPELNVEEIVSGRRITLPPFHLPYETVEEIQMRLMGTIILIKNNPFYVENVIRKNNDYHLVVSNEEEERTIVKYNQGQLDLRSPEPGYINTEGGSYYFVRPPNRQQRQGIIYNQIFLKKIGSEEMFSPHNKNAVMIGLKFRDVQPWTSELCNLLQRRIISNMRLSNSIAIYIDHRKIKSEYKGRFLGEVHDDTILLDDRDRRPWILSDLKDVSMRSKQP